MISLLKLTSNHSTLEWITPIRNQRIRLGWTFFSCEIFPKKNADHFSENLNHSYQSYLEVDQFFLQKCDSLSQFSTPFFKYFSIDAVFFLYVVHMLDAISMENPEGESAADCHCPRDWELSDKRVRVNPAVKKQSPRFLTPPPPPFPSISTGVLCISFNSLPSSHSLF